MILNVILWCLFGLVAGAIAQFLMPGRDPGQSSSPAGFLITIVLGIVGAILGGFLGSRLFGWDVSGFNLTSLVVAIGGALLVLLLYRAAVGGTGSSASRR